MPVSFTTYGGDLVPRIEFRGKTYNSEFEMPYDIRQAYNREKERRAEKKTAAKSLTDVVDMSPEVKAIYERAVGKVEEKLPSSRPSIELPDTEDIYRQSAPDSMKHLPSDESIYRPSPPAVNEIKPAIEPESGVRRLLTSILWAFLIVAVVLLGMQFFP
jgi:hypothetical protein